MLKSFSLLKLSRYFFAWFLAITVVPMLCLQLWNDYHLKKAHRDHERGFLEFLSGDVVTQSKKYLHMQVNDIERIAKTIDHNHLNLDQYETLFNAQNVWWLDSPEAKGFLEQHCGGSLSVSTPHGRVIGDYCLNQRNIDAVFIFPAQRGHRGLIIDKTVPFKLFLPPGPMRVEVYQGTTVTPSGLLASLQDPFQVNAKRFHRFIIRGPGDGMVFGSTGPMPPPEQNVVYRQIPLKNRNGQTVVTIRLKMMMPGPPPGGGIQQWMGAIILLTGLIASVFAGYYIHKNFIEPLTGLSVLTYQVQKGDLTSRLDTSKIRQPEVLQTMENVNAMLEQLSEKERLRNNFVSNLTHDFRTPLIAQARSLELFIKDFDELALTQQSKLAHSLLKNNEHLLTMVNQLLETYRFEAGKLKLTMESISLSEAVEQSFEKLLPLAETRKITLEQEFPVDFPKIEADGQALTRVFVNLIGNAIENIPKGSLIRITGQLTLSGEVEIHVRDNGPGILPEDLPHLFDRYYAGMGDTRKLGSGLGLYICKMFIEAHQGTIDVDSAPNQYTDFIIRLPLQEGR